MNNNSNIQKLKLEDIEMTNFVAPRVQTAVCFGWEPTVLDGNILIMAQVKGKPAKFVSEKTDDEKLMFLMMNTKAKTMLTLTSQKLYGAMSNPLVSLKSQFGPHGQVLVDRATKALLAEDFEKAQQNVREACQSNKSFVNKVQTISGDALSSDYEDVAFNLMKKAIKKERKQQKSKTQTSAKPVF